MKSTSPPSILSSFFTVSSNVILSLELMSALTALSSFGSVFYDVKKYFGLGTISHCIFSLINTFWKTIGPNKKETLLYFAK